MPILFSRLCDLLSELEKLHIRKRPLSPKALEEKCKRHITKWFEDHRTLIDADGTNGVALLSSLLPARRSDRVYGLQAPSLTKELERWKEPNGGDLGICIEKILKDTPNSLQNLVTIEQIDAVLDGVAARCRFSGPEIQAKKDQRDRSKIDDKLGTIYYRLGPNEAKWFTRMLLKDYCAVVVPEGLVFWCFHRLLPSILKVYDNFQAAVALLKDLDLSGAKMTPGILSQAEARRQHDTVAKAVLPRCGVKVGRPLFHKAWSIKRALELAHGRRMSLERKYDGEYCQIHVDLGKSGNEIQIFSKSRKDSTKDRRGLHETIKKCLRIGEDHCQIKQKCILEGELLVWSTKESKILPFHKIRKHVRRSGYLLGTARDSQVHSWEQLMIVFFDVLLVDDDPVLHQPHRRRRERLMELIDEIPGRASLAQCREINFSRRGAAELLTEALVDAFARRWEGCVLKPADEPYVNFQPWVVDDYRSDWIKLKKDYIPGLGDTAEFAVVGAGYDAKEASRLGLTHLPWTVFHIGALSNKEEVSRLGAKPRFLVLDSFNTSIGKENMKRLCQIGRFRAVDVRASADYGMLEILEGNPNVHKMDVVFTPPFVFEVTGGGFDKPANYDRFVLRFPRVLKIHWHRTFQDTVTFDELQDLAHQATNAPEGDLLTEIAIWKERVNSTHPRQWSHDSGGEDEEADSDSDAEKIPSSPTLINSLINMKTPREQTFVRMDTSEMLPSEQRLHTGEVILQALSSRSTSTVESTSTLPSLPASSPPLQLVGADAPNKISLPSGRKRSRPADVELSISPPPRKIRRGKSMVSVKSSLPAVFLSPVVLRASLEEIARNAVPSPKTRRGPPDVSHKAYQSSPLTLVQNLLPRVPVKSTRKPVLESTSSLHHTTGSERTTSGASLPISKPSPTIPINPNFAQALTVLSPCIASMPYLTEDLLPSHNATVVSISKLSARSPTSTITAKKDVIVLVESFRDGATALFLKVLLPLMGMDLREIEIWDWRIVEQMKGGEGRLGRWFVGWIRSDAMGDWVLVWKNGDVTKAR
ncbi:hypothetical protein MMC18_008236 [Xylographa bjoerkii]|nr:hypothetical protein [Xylographa bjoerkii]